MKAIEALVLAAGALTLIAAAAPALGAEESSGLVRVPSRQFEHVAVLPGTDFRPYAKAFVDPASVTFRSDWLKDMNANRIAVLQGTTRQDADGIAREVGSGLHAALVRALQKGGYEIAAQPGPGVMVLAPHLVKLYVNAPNSVTTALPGRVYTSSAGEGTFELTVRDSVSGRVLAHVVDARTIGDRGDLHGSMRSTTTVSNGFDFANTFDQWARGTVKTLDQLRTAPTAAAGAPAQ
jgi:hypothetical protein